MSIYPYIKKAPATMVVGSMFSTQFSATLATHLFSQAGAGGAALLRLTFATLILLILWRPKLSRYDRSAKISAIKFGIALGSMNLFFYESIARIPLGIAVTIEFAGPLAIAMIGSKRRLDTLWVLLAASGIVLLSLTGTSTNGGGLDVLGIVFALLAGVCWALYIIFAAKSNSHFTSGDGLALATCVAAGITVIPGISEAGTSLLDPTLLAIGAVVGFASSVVPYTMETEALRYLPKNLFGIIMSLDPAVAMLAGWIVLNQQLSGIEIFAIVLVICASVGAERTTTLPTISEGS